MTQRRRIYKEYIQILPAGQAGAESPVVTADELGARLGSPPPAERAVETFVRVSPPEAAPPAAEPAAALPQARPPITFIAPEPEPIAPRAAAPIVVTELCDLSPPAAGAPLLPRRAWFADRMTLAAAAVALVVAGATAIWLLAVRSHTETETAALRSSVTELKQRLAARDNRPAMPPSRYAEHAAPATPAAPTAAPAAASPPATPPAPAAAVPPPPPLPTVATLQLRPSVEPEAAPAIIEDWVLREVFRGRALVEGRRGFFEVAVGAPLPGLGRVEAIESRNGRMVVVTERGLIVPAH